MHRKTIYAAFDRLVAATYLVCRNRRKNSLIKCKKLEEIECVCACQFINLTQLQSFHWENRIRSSIRSCASHPMRLLFNILRSQRVNVDDLKLIVNRPAIKFDQKKKTNEKTARRGKEETKIKWQIRKKCNRNIKMRTETKMRNGNWFEASKRMQSVILFCAAAAVNCRQPKSFISNRLCILDKTRNDQRDVRSNNRRRRRRGRDANLIYELRIHKNEQKKNICDANEENQFSILMPMCFAVSKAWNNFSHEFRNRLKCRHRLNSTYFDWLSDQFERIFHFVRFFFSAFFSYQFSSSFCILCGDD